MTFDRAVAQLEDGCYWIDLDEVTFGHAIALGWRIDVQGGRAVRITNRDADSSSPRCYNVSWDPGRFERAGPLDSVAAGNAWRD